jgi:plasmid maintenance system antidote protein VapI
MSAAALARHLAVPRHRVSSIIKREAVTKIRFLRLRHSLELVL